MPSLTDYQLSSLGINTIGDRATGNAALWIRRIPTLTPSVDGSVNLFIFSLVCICVSVWFALVLGNGSYSFFYVILSLIIIKNYYSFTLRNEIVPYCTVLYRTSTVFLASVHVVYDDMWSM